MRNWFFFFSNEQRTKVDQLRKDNYDSFKTWAILTEFLPLLPFIISVAIRILINGFDNWGKVFNNGSIPIISFGIIASGISFLMEKLELDDEIIEHIKRRVMAIAVVMLFLTASLFIFESLNDKLFTNECPATIILQNGIILLASIICYWYSVRVGQHMFFLQKQIIDSGDDYSTGTQRQAIETHGTEW